jgi:DNA helicase-2/ATP-dependent DNA helicase PcrA
VVLSTIHAAKGLEWVSVFVLNVVEGCIPLDLGKACSDEIEEERRLLHVAMTRAKDQLYLLMPRRASGPQGKPSSGASWESVRSRFIPSELLDHFEQWSWPGTAPQTDIIADYED